MAACAAVGTGVAAGPAELAAQGLPTRQPLGAQAVTPPTVLAAPTIDATASAATATPTLHAPYGVAVDALGQVYVANLGGGVTVYNRARTLIATITAGVNSPSGVGVAFGGNTYVANNGGNNVTIYNSAFVQIGTITDPSLQYPTGIFVDAVNDVWVLDSGTVHLYLDNGTPISTAPAGGATAIGPWGSNVIVWGQYAGGGSFHDLFQNIGEAVHSGISFANGFLDSSPAGGQAQDALGQQYETDPNNNRVVIWAANGTQAIAAIPTASPGYGIAVDSIHKRFYVAEPGVNQVVAYSTVAPYTQLGVIK
jgi:hypothetical protein